MTKKKKVKVTLKVKVKAKNVPMDLGQMRNLIQKMGSKTKK